MSPFREIPRFYRPKASHRQRNVIRRYRAEAALTARLQKTDVRPSTHNGSEQFGSGTQAYA